MLGLADEIARDFEGPKSVILPSFRLHPPASPLRLFLALCVTSLVYFYVASALPSAPHPSSAASVVVSPPTNKPTFGRRLDVRPRANLAFELRRTQLIYSLLTQDPWGALLDLVFSLC